MLKEKKTYLIFAFSLLLGISGYFYWTHKDKISSKTIPQAQIAFVNLSRIRNEADALIHLRQLVEEEYKNFKDEIHGKEVEIRSEHNTLETLPKRTAKEKKEFQIRQKAHDQRIKEVSLLIQEKKAALHANFSSITESIEVAIQDIINQLAKESHLNLIFNSSTLDTSVILYGGEELDITDQVLSELNDKLPTVKLPSKQ